MDAGRLDFQQQVGAADVVFVLADICRAKTTSAAAPSRAVRTSPIRARSAAWRT